MMVSDAIVPLALSGSPWVTEKRPKTSEPLQEEDVCPGGARALSAGFDPGKNPQRFRPEGAADSGLAITGMFEIKIFSR
jgi:hypothetical protein